MNVQERYLAVGTTRILICVPTVKRDERFMCLDGVLFPSGCLITLCNLSGHKVAASYNEAGRMALDHDYLMTVEDDTFPPDDALYKLLRLCRSGKVIAGGWYRKKQRVLEGVPIVVRDGWRVGLEADGQVHSVYTMPNGCTLIPSSAFREIKPDWFVTTDQLTQDSYFSQLAREAGWELLVDTSIRCGHRCRTTGKVWK